RRVVDRHRSRLEHRARDPRRLALEVEVHLRPPVDVLAAGARQVAGRLAPVVGDDGQRGEAEVEELGELVEQGARDAFDVRGPGELVGDAADALELPRRISPPALPGAAATQHGRQKRYGGRGAAERANGREQVWGPHWAVEIVRSRVSRG